MADIKCGTFFLSTATNKELPESEVLKISVRVNKGEMLENILLTGYSDIRISVVRGYDTFSRDEYYQSAHFSRKKAQNEIQQMKPNGDSRLADTYRIFTFSFVDIFEKKDNVCMRFYNEECSESRQEYLKNCILNSLKNSLPNT